MKLPPTASPPRPRRSISFRTLLLAAILGLIVASSVSTTWIGVHALGTVIRALLEQQIETTLDAVTGRVEDLFEPSDRLLLSLAKRVRNGSFPTGDPLTVARTLAEALEFEEGINWISFGYPDGGFAGAWAEDGGIVINISRPGRLPQEWRIAPDGGLEPFARATMPTAFDSRERQWFQLAKENGGMVWTPPYEFADGDGPGISVTKAVRADDGTLLGVFSVDFLLRDVTDYLEELKQEFQGDTLVFSIRGHIIASAKDLHANPIIARIREELESKGVWEDLRNNGGHLRMDFPVEGDTYVAGVRRAKVPGDLDCVSAIIFSRNQAFGAQERIIKHGVIAALVALAVSLVVGFLLAGKIAGPLGALAKAVARISHFDLSPHPMPRSDVREIRTLSESIEVLRTGIQSFSHYVPVDLVRDLVKSGGVAELGGEKRQVALLFCDLAGFTAYAETNPPEDAVDTLTSYFEDFGRAIEASGGVIDKFMGDGIMALFNAPARLPNPSSAACEAALNAVAAMKSRGSTFSVRVGLHSGECLVGNVGTSNRFSYTAIGDCVNLASRLESLNKKYGSHILASSTFREAAGDADFVWRWLDRVAVAGRSAPLDIYELLDFRASATGAAIDVAESYTAAFEAFLQRDFEAALQRLAPWVDHDEPSHLLAERIQKSRDIDGDWDGVRRYSQK